MLSLLNQMVIAILVGSLVVWSLLTLSWTTLFVLLVITYLLLRAFIMHVEKPIKPIKQYDEMSDKQLGSFMGM